MDELRRVRVLANDGVSPLIQIEDEYGTCWVKRGRVHLVGTEYVISSERQADIARKALNTRAKREAVRIAKEKLAKATEPKIQTEVAA